MLCPKRALLYAVLLAVLLDPISGRKRHRNKSDRRDESSGEHQAYVSSQGRLNYQGKPYVGSHGIVSYHTTYKNKYQYSPPESLAYSPSRGKEAVQYPVYQGTPPNYVYKYKSSGSKYGTLLTGLALLNLGALGVGVYSHIKDSSRRTPQPNEVCKFEVKKDNGYFEETKIDCEIISSFPSQDKSINTTTNTTRSVVTGSGRRRKPIVVQYEMLRNGTLVTATTAVPDVPVAPGSPLNVTQNVTGAVSRINVANSSVLTTTKTNTKTNRTLMNALDLKGRDVAATEGMHCFVSRTSPTHSMRRDVPCGLLQAYADSSIKVLKSAAHNGPRLGIVTVIVCGFLKRLFLRPF